MIKHSLSQSNESPFFIFYVSRSGSTLLSRLIVENSLAIIPPESRFLKYFLIQEKGNINDILLKSITLLKRDRKFYDWEINLTELKSFVRSNHNSNEITVINILIYILQFYMYKEIGEIFTLNHFGFKKGSYIEYKNNIKKIFPSAKFICLIRDVRGVYLSQKTSIYTATGEPFADKPQDTIKTWLRFTNHIEEIKSIYPEDHYLIKYEDLIDNTDSIIDAILKFIDVQKSPNNIFNYKIPDRYNNLHSNVNKNIIKNNDKKWEQHLTEEEITLLTKSCSVELRQFGYL